MPKSKLKKIEIFYYGKNIDLCILNNYIIKNSNWYKWFNNKKLTKYTEQGVFPNSLKKQLIFLRENIIKKKDIFKRVQDDKKIQLGIVKNRELIGIISLYRFDYRNRCCEISCVINHIGLKNSLIYFKEAQDLMLKHAFNKMNFNRVQTTVYDKKLVDLSVKLFNFKKEGTLRKRVFIDGNYLDAYMLGILKKEFKSSI